MSSCLRQYIHIFKFPFYDGRSRILHSLTVNLILKISITCHLVKVMTG